MNRSIVFAVILITNAALAERQTSWEAHWHYWTAGHATLTAGQLARIR